MLLASLSSMVVLAGDAVALGVEAGLGFAFDGAGAGGFERVAAVGRDLFFGCHDDLQL
jgi:hypothetical protein